PAQLAPPRTAASRLLAKIFSSNKTAVQTMRAPGKMRPHSLRSVPVLKLHPATWLLLPLCVGSFAKLAAWGTSTQDGVEISLTFLFKYFRPEGRQDLATRFRFFCVGKQNIYFQCVTLS